MKTLSRTGIEYCINPNGSRGYAWNVITGCRHRKEQCSCRDICWARAMTKRYPDMYPHGFEPTFHEDRLGLISTLKQPSTILVNFMGDMWGDWVDREWIERILIKATYYNNHTYLFLTKNPKRYVEFIGYFGEYASILSNAYLGVSRTDKPLDISILEDIKKANKNLWISYEPFQGWNIREVDLADWIVIGVRQGQNAVKNRELIDIFNLITYADIKHKPIFLKDNLMKLHIGYADFNNYALKTFRELPYLNIGR